MHTMFCSPTWFPKYTHHDTTVRAVPLRMPFTGAVRVVPLRMAFDNSDLLQAPLPLLPGAVWAMEALAVANAQGLSLEPSTNAAGYRGVKITKRSRARPFQASPQPLNPPAGGPPRSARSARSARSTLRTLRTLTPDYPTWSSRLSRVPTLLARAFHRPA